ncbi:hypothetical protein LEMLEM_LOCUS15150 [Lemmus lemmus]
MLSERRQSALRLSCYHHNRQDGHLQTEHGDFEMATICQPLQVRWAYFLGEGRVTPVLYPKKIPGSL